MAIRVEAPRRQHRTWWETICICGFAIALSLFVFAAPSVSAQTRDGLTVSTVKTYTPEIENERIVVTASYTMTNQQPDEIVGNSVRSFYYTSWSIVVPETATDIQATSNGTPLRIAFTSDESSEDFLFGTITLPFNLNYRQTVTIDLSYVMPGAEPRSDGLTARVNDSFLSFPVWAAGDPGATDVRINVPPGFAFDLEGGVEDMTMDIEDGAIFFEALDIDEPQQFFGQIYGRNDDGLLTETADLSNATATVRAWPDDPEWAALVVDAIENDVPVIEDLTGLSWPAGDIEIIETVTPYLYGYGGWFDATSGQIEVGDALERGIILHELSHGWFNNDLIGGRWVTEGLAEEYASRAIEADGDVRPDPEQPDLDDPVRVPLNAWASPWTLEQDEAFDYEEYHYNASWFVIRQVTDDIGLPAFAEVLGALERDELAYLGTGPAEQTQTPTQWTHLFDLLDRRSQAEGLDDLFSTYVLTSPERAQLVDRRETLTRYDQLVASADSWSPPLVIRRELGQWRFEEAAESTMLASEAITQRDAVNALAATLDLAVTHPQTDFEVAASSLDLQRVINRESALERELLDLQTERERIRELAAELDGFVSFDPIDLADAQSDIATREAAIGDARELRNLVADAASDLDLDAPVWPTSDEPTDFAADAALSQARLATLDTLAEATTSVERPRSITQQVGLWFSSVDEDLAAARAHFEADELNDSLASAAASQSLVEQSAILGRNRLSWAGGATTLLLISAFFVTRTRRERKIA